MPQNHKTLPTWTYLIVSGSTLGDPTFNPNIPFSWNTPTDEEIKKKQTTRKNNLIVFLPNQIKSNQTQKKIEEKMSNGDNMT
jgi:hypothetical protein